MNPEQQKTFEYIKAHLDLIVPNMKALERAIVASRDNTPLRNRLLTLHTALHKRQLELTRMAGEL